MSSQASVGSIEALKEFRVALALFAEDATAALGAVDMEVRRTSQWLQHDRQRYWQEQLKRRKERVAQASAELFRKKLAQKGESGPSATEQKENLRRAEESFREAEMRAALVKKWEPALQAAILEYRGSTRRINSIASGDVPRALALLGRMIDALEDYLRVAPPSGAAGPSPFESIAESILASDPGPAAEAGDAEPDAPAESDPGPLDTDH